MIWGEMSTAAVGKLSFLKSTVTTTVQQIVLEDFMIPSAEDLNGDTGPGPGPDHQKHQDPV